MPPQDVTRLILTANQKELIELTTASGETIRFWMYKEGHKTKVAIESQRSVQITRKPRHDEYAPAT